jgi:hypothetical protein
MEEQLRRVLDAYSLPCGAVIATPDAVVTRVGDFESFGSAGLVSDLLGKDWSPAATLGALADQESLQFWEQDDEFAFAHQPAPDRTVLVFGRVPGEWVDRVRLLQEVRRTIDEVFSEGRPTPAKTVLTGTRVPASEQTRPSGKRQFKSGMVGIAKGQIARLNIVNTSDDLGLPSPTIVMGFTVNPRSERLAQTTVTLDPGVSAYLDLSWDAIARPGENRHQVRAEVTADNDPMSACVVTLEVFDNETGKTMVYLHIAVISPRSR